MENENIQLQLQQLDYMLNIISNMKNDYAKRYICEKEDIRKEMEQEPVSYGYITTYQKQNGSTFKKRTKNRPFDYSFQRQYIVGDTNSFGHKVILIVEDIQLNLGLNDICMDKKWYV